MTKLREFPQTLKEPINEIMKKNAFSNSLFEEIAKSLTRRQLNPLKGMMRSSDDVVTSIKWLILLHNIIKYGCKGRNEQIDALIKMVRSRQKKNMSKVQNLLLEKLVVPYKAYLLKRNLYTQSQVDMESESFVLINLMKKMGMFSNVLFTLGRYFYKDHRFLSEFNIILAKDLGDLYRKLRTKINMDILSDNADIIQELHQSMFIVYYNCYFGKLVVNYTPYWIDTEEIVKQKDIKNRVSCNKRRIASNHQLLVEQELHNQSIVIEETETSCSEFIKTASTIHTSSNIKDTPNEKTMKERLQFIQEASNMLGLAIDESLQLPQTKVLRCF